MPELIGQSLGRYHILEQLGQGGMATVYKAYDTRLERDVAVKLIRQGAFPPDQLERILKRFEREAKALARLSHPNIVGVIDYGDHEGAPYLVMEYLPGGTLKGVPDKPLTWQAAFKIVLPVAQALDYAHSQKIVHRDVKPSNILMTQTGQPMLTDFGIAKILESDEGMSLTGTGVGMGTPEYMAPEQVDARSVDGRADIYSLGIVLYELIIGRPPYVADTPMAVMIMQMRDPLPRPGSFLLGLDERVEKLLLKTLAKNPHERYQSMDELAKAMENLLAHAGTPAQALAGAAENATADVLDGAPPRAAPGASDPAQAGIDLLRKAQGLVPLLLLPLAANVKMGFVSVPAGEFEMGAADGAANAQPAHKVMLDAYLIGRTPVTNRQYLVFVEAQRHPMPQHWKAGRIPAGWEDHPVVHVTWEDAAAFCEWAGRLGGRPVRLPTEAEWEKAARGTDGRLHPWGAFPPDRRRCNYVGQEKGTTMVGKYSPQGDSPYGCADMAGNVWEWCNDLYDEKYYTISPLANPAGPAGGQHRVLRGGAWYGSELSICATFRGGSDPANTNVNIGFRCACSLPPGVDLG